MDQILEQQVREAEERVALGECHIARQIEVVRRLNAQSLDATSAEQLLDIFLDSQALHIAERDRLAAELNARNLPKG